MGGLVTSVMAYFLMLLNLPPASPIRETEPGETGFITPSQGIVLFTGGLLGFSDSCFMTQVSSKLDNNSEKIIGTHYHYLH